MKNKKTLVAIVLVLLVAVVGVTFAYFQSTAQFENLFNVGIYKVVSTEVFESPDNWTPGQEIPKTITTTNEGTIPAAVRVSFTEQWLDGDTDITSQIDEGTAIINFDNTSDWTKEGNYYYYNYILEPEQTTSSFMKSVTLSSSINGITCTPSNDGLTQSCESDSPIQGATYKLTITKETIQADKYQDLWNTEVEITEKPEPVVRILSGTKGNLQAGDVVGIGDTEDFYVLSSDNSENGKTILLAKYNLYVGSILDYNNSIDEYDFTTIDSSYPGHGLQNVDATAYSGYPHVIGSAYFSQTNYWDNGTGLKSEYAKDLYGNPASYSGNPYPYVYDENSNIYQYISGENGYVNTLKEMGAPSTITGRLPAYEELYAVEDIVVEGEKVLGSGLQTYWTGSCSSDDTLNFVMQTYLLDGGGVYYSNNYDGGVRPIIEIYTNDIN